MLTDQPDLMSWRGASTTSGPRPTAARRIVAAGHKRVSAKAIVELARAEFATPINNSATAGLGEWLSEHEDLRPYVERRGKAAP